jgi:hypothetical protein
MLAQCQRLKLNCDRRIPCNACQVRDCIDGCTYAHSQMTPEGRFVYVHHAFIDDLSQGITTSNSNDPGNIFSSLPQHAIEEISGDRPHQSAFDHFLSWGSTNAFTLADIDTIQTVRGLIFIKTPLTYYSG